VKFMKVSVIIPTYNRREDLAELLDSLLLQTYKPLEVIVVDDTPTNDIADMCGKFYNKFRERDVNLIYHKNLGKRSSAIARNLGVEKSSGDILMFFDSDVILFPDYIEKILEVFMTNSRALAVQGWIINIERKKFYYLRQVFYKIFCMSHHAKDSCRLFEYPSALTKVIECEALSGANFAVKREVFNHLQFDGNLLGYAYMEDLLFSHSLFKRFPHSLFITPYAKCIHKVSQMGREEKDKLERHKQRCRLYVFTKLFGWKGRLLYNWQNLGGIILKISKRLIKD